MSESALMCAQVFICTWQHKSSPLHYQIYCKAPQWENTHALPSVCAAPWQLLLYIPLQMRAVNCRDYRVEQSQWGRWGKRKSEESLERKPKQERERERRRATDSTRQRGWSLLLSVLFIFHEPQCVSQAVLEYKKFCSENCYREIKGTGGMHRFSSRILGDRLCLHTLLQ